MRRHIVSSYDHDIEALERMVAEMGGLCEGMLASAFEALERRDPGIAERTVASDAAVDALERAIQEHGLHMLTRRQPVADDLRLVLTVFKIASDLERIGDLAKGFARRSLLLVAQPHPPSLIAGLGHMTERALIQLKTVLDAVADRDAGKAMAVWREDSQIDALNGSILRELLARMAEDPRAIRPCTHLMLAAKGLERIGDHTTNIAESVHYLVHGRLPEALRPKRDDVTAIPLASRRS